MKPPVIVAEISANHLGDEERAHMLVRLAHQCGADMVKFQTYDPMKLVGDLGLKLEEGPWKGRRLVELYQEAWTPRSWHKSLFAHARKLGVTPFSSPFSADDVDFLETLGCGTYKIASFEITDLDLIGYAAQTGKPLVISTGMASLREIEDAVDHALRYTRDTMTLLKCTSGYPAPVGEANLATIPDLREYFAQVVKVGLSDHTLGIAVPVAAAALGATMIEKHLTDSRMMGGPDAEFSAEPQEFAQMVHCAKLAAEAVGEVRYGPTESEAPQLKLRRALWVVADMMEGEAFSRKNLRSARPCLVAGLPLAPIGEVLGKRARRAIKAGTLFSPELAG